MSRLAYLLPPNAFDQEPKNLHRFILERLRMHHGIEVPDPLSDVLMALCERALPQWRLDKIRKVVECMEDSKHKEQIERILG